MGHMRSAHNGAHMGHVISTSCNVCGTHEKCIYYTYWSLNFKEQDHLEEYDNIKIPFNIIGAVFIEFTCFTVGTSGRLSLWHLTIGFHKGQRIS